MKTKPELPFPRINFDAIPAAEQESANRIHGNFNDLSAICLRFEDALVLSDHCRELFHEFRAAKLEGFSKRRLAMSWGLLATREAGMTLGDFLQTLEWIKKNTRTCRTIADLLPESEIEALIDRYKAAFPDPKHIRNASAHPTDLTSNPDRQHHITGPYEESGVISAGEGSKIMLSGLDGDQAFFTYGHKLLKFAFNADTLGTLRNFQRELIDIFDRHLDVLIED